jgi:hypothetical protein
MGLGRSSMDHVNDAVGRPEPQAGAVRPPPQPPSAAEAVFQEINARRAQVEKPELLRHLRGL